MIEKCIYLKSYSFLKKINNLSSFQRVYFGNEVCEYLFPDFNEILEAIKFLHNQNIKFSLITPPVGEKNFNKIIKIVEQFIDKIEQDIFIIVNDYGILNKLNIYSDKIHIEFGRILYRNIKDLRFFKTQQKFEYHIGPIVRNSFKNALKKLNINSIAIDNNFLSNEIDFFPELPFELSLYFPLILVSTGRKCLLKKINNTKENCIRTCDNIIFNINKFRDFPLILKGNSIYYKNDFFPENIEKINIKRTIYFP